MEIEPVRRATCKIRWRLQEVSGHDFSRALTHIFSLKAILQVALTFWIFWHTPRRHSLQPARDPLLLLPGGAQDRGPTVFDHLTPTAHGQ